MRFYLNTYTFIFINNKVTWVGFAVREHNSFLKKHNYRIDSRIGMEKVVDYRVNLN